MFGKIPLSKIGLVVGSILTVVGLIAYGQGNATLNLAGFFYGIPLFLGGLALKASELKPVPFTQPTTPEILALRAQQATVIQNKLRKDVTRYCYGQQAHLDEVLKRFGLVTSDKEFPTLIGIRETETQSAYTIILEFEPALLPLETWASQQEKMEKFFGPNIKLVFSQPKEDHLDLALITQTETPSV